MDPIDYTITAQNPMAAFLGGLQGGVQVQGLQQQNQQRQMLAEAQAAEMAAREQKALAEAEELQRQAAFDAAIEAASGPNFDAVKLSELSMLMPKDRAKAIQDGIASRSTEQQKNDLLEQTTLMSALVSGKLDVARDMIGTKVSAFRNSGKENEAKHMEAMLAGLADDNPSDVIVGIGSIMSQYPGGPEVLKAIQAQQQVGAEIDKTKSEAEIKKAEAAAVVEKIRLELNLSKASAAKIAAETKKLGLESQKAALELEAMKQSGGIPPEKVFEQEEKLRKEFTTRTAKYNEMSRAFANIKSSAADNSGAGDVALVTSFMKMLDPGSVVRETEFATARDTAGLLERLKNTAKKLESGAFLDASQRTSFERLAGQYMAAAKADEKRVKDSLSVVVKNYKLNPENVFSGYTAADQKPPVFPYLTMPQGFEVIR